MYTIRQKKLARIKLPLDLRYQQIIGIVYLVSIIIIGLTLLLKGV